MTYCNIHNSLQNLEPLSDKTAIVMPLLQNSFANEAATEVALLSGKEMIQSVLKINRLQLR